MRGRILDLCAGIAPIVFEIVDAPRGILRRVLVFVAPGPGPAAAGLRSSVGIDAEFESLGMDVVAERLHTRGKALRVGLDISMRVARALPAIVDHNIEIAGVAHSGGD